MKNFDRSNHGGSRGDKWGKKRDFNDNAGSRPGMHQTVCSDCGQKCEVPFRPTGDRPVYCSQCFGKHSSSSSASSRPQGRDFQKPSFEKKRMFSAVCDKCGQKCEVPFRPTGDKPVYCSQCFGKDSKPAEKAADSVRQQLEILNSKLDKILKVLVPAAAVSAPKEAKPVKVTAKKKTIAKPAKKAKTKKK
ncbi:MAG: CxxC-x17-CxxC domain-containing protein [Patescibacteria group bacterium]|jgi:CxxC-x17-CxxC domain-containing protein